MNWLTKMLMVGVFTVVLVLNINTGFATEEEQTIFEKANMEFSGSLDFYSDYIWRGFTLDTDPVIQPGANVSLYGFTFSFWSSWDVDNNNDMKSNEIDYVIDYTYDFKYISLSGGHTYYDFPGAGTFSKEWYVGAAFPTIPLTPSFTFYYDYADEEQGGGDGQYVVLDLSYSIPLEFIPSRDITLDLGGHVGFNNELFIAGEGADVFFTAGLTVPLTKNLSISPNINYSIPFGDLEDSDDGAQEDRFFGGFSLGYSF